MRMRRRRAGGPASGDGNRPGILPEMEAMARPWYTGLVKTRCRCPGVEVRIRRGALRAFWCDRASPNGDLPHLRANAGRDAAAYIGATSGARQGSRCADGRGLGGAAGLLGPAALGEDRVEAVRSVSGDAAIGLRLRCASGHQRTFGANREAQLGPGTTRGTRTPVSNICNHQHGGTSRRLKWCVARHIGSCGFPQVSGNGTSARRVQTTMYNAPYATHPTVRSASHLRGSRATAAEHGGRDRRW